MRINWKVRLQHIPFLLGLFSLLLLLAQQVAAIFGYDLTAAMSEQISSILNTVLSILVLMGVIVDPTTRGTSDSERALMYRRPR
ncbi:phage holin [Lysinibacillus irui]|uniref:Phage holin n=1 Tax=Lysinibacillus irui TaxID=2998077 RepID=A0AAJ5UWD5_9BACI|nr:MULTISPECIES: phage holin [Lysinibacillus]MEA0551934.1 phage holin [Lysinibacillus irui]MEA0563412.1 phage holin [Lysinibacillus irui]MEA0977859.1 phage holin [Lysinibacillus irui]MEA1044013.1 phage holin [Lysinibacillus irui]WDV07977.1 phage holin [Lysinibacillus irui]